MKTPKINFREENVDSFMEILAVAKKLGYPKKYFIKNKPLGYVLDEELGIKELETTKDKAVCFNTFNEEFSFTNLFRMFEPVDEIKNRIDRVYEVDNANLDEPSKTLLKNATEKLKLSKDQIQNIIELSCIIGSMDGSVCEAQHIAEAIHYSYIFED
jgi:hypothetical protein